MAGLTPLDPEPVLLLVAPEPVEPVESDEPLEADEPVEADEPLEVSAPDDPVELGELLVVAVVAG